MNNFQTILIAVFLAFFVFAVLVFSGAINMPNIFGNKDTGTASGNVVVWGTFPNTVFETSIDNISSANKDLNLSYSQKNISTYQQDLVEAFANGTGPDLFIITPDMIKKNTNFISKMPYTNYPRKAFTDLFIDGASIYLDSDGIIGYPLMVDPVVLYYNKDILSNESIVYPPTTWDELFNLSSKLIKKGKDGNITQGMVALGQYDNVNHAKDILSMLLLQSNNPIAIPLDKGYRSTLKDSAANGSNSMEQIVNFFLEFSNPSNESYSWNRSLPNSLDMFTSGKLAFYIGYGSELFNIESINPNLSFNVAEIPKTKGTNIRRTYGNFHSIFVSKKSANMAVAQSVAAMITEDNFLKELSIRTSLPTAKRSLLADKPSDAYLSTFFDQAIISRSWLDPNDGKTDSIFRELIENSLSNKFSVSSSVDKAHNQLDLILKNIYE